ncbi:MAG: translation initiation factor IF-3 [Eubacteriales bacterium]|nr:translation initiation factor IF-3 [Clostridiales bacterium]MDD2441486.1 translation initiation factor IF-3 [Eubacteriales bacterium]MDD4139371.1 translation initiation factor IF-3 [Eubacteriales bacterium]MDD4744519.1 translation initiation factor IF-3 [Eubacteriales bacterium]
MINEEIRFPRVRLIDSSGSMVGVVPIAEARRKAEEESLDLVLINAQADNPVCKIMDYGRYMFELAKKEREAKKNQKTTSVKEVGFRMTTEEHDMGYKTKNACRFLEEGDRVKVVIKFRGREMAYTSRGYDVMKKFAQACADFGQVDREPKVEGRNMVMFLAPHKN